MNHESVVASATRTLAEHWTGRYTVPSRRLYPHQWSWDSAFVAFGLRHLAPARAERELLSLFEAQWPDGRIPHITFDPAVPRDAYYPGPDFWDSAARGGPAHVETTGLVQPPIHAWAAWATYLADPDPVRGREFLDVAYPALARWHGYLRTRRTPAGQRLFALVHPWESGMDNSPSWDRPLARVLPLPPGSLARRDLHHAEASERPTDGDYGRYMRLATAYRDGRYADDVASAPFAVQDPLSNALFAVSELALAAIAGELGDAGAAREHRDRSDALRAALVERLYDADAGIFFARDLGTGEPLGAYTVGGLAPLVVPGLPVAGEVLKTALGERFRLGRTGLVPSYDLTSPAFDPARYWRGPGWFNMTWLIWQGLLGQGEREQAAAVREAMLHTAEHRGLPEYVDPRTGQAHGAAGLSWSAAVVLDAIHRPEGTVVARADW